MYTNPPTLRIRSPSSTTVEFTVTNAPPGTVSRRILAIIVAQIRLGLFIAVVSLLTVKCWPGPPFPQAVPPLFHPMLERLSRFAEVVHWQTMLPASLITLYLVFFTGGYTEESLVVIRDLGVQISTRTGWWGGRRSRFIPTSCVGDLWIHEGFRGFEVRFYLAVVVEGEEGLVVVFPVGLLHFRFVLGCSANLDRLYCPIERYWNLYGEEQRNVFTSQSSWQADAQGE